MTIKALTRPARVGRTTTQLSEARLSRRAPHTTVRDSPRLAARWIVKDGGRPVLTWQARGRARSPIERKRGSHA
jgi:hypothetical protein